MWNQATQAAVASPEEQELLQARLSGSSREGSSASGARRAQGNRDTNSTHHRDQSRVLETKPGHEEPPRNTACDASQNNEADRSKKQTVVSLPQNGKASDITADQT